MAEGARYCDEPECMRKVFCGGKCRGHYARVEKRNGVRGPLRVHLGPRAALLEAVLSVADAEEEAEYRAAWKRLVYHGRRVFGEGSGKGRGD